MEPRQFLPVEGIAVLALAVALVWAGHIGADRALGYGLKFATGFKDTHLTQQPAPLAQHLVHRDGCPRHSVVPAFALPPHSADRPM